MVCSTSRLTWALPSVFFMVVFVSPISLFQKLNPQTMVLSWEWTSTLFLDDQEQHVLLQSSTVVEIYTTPALDQALSHPRALHYAWHTSNYPGRPSVVRRTMQIGYIDMGDCLWLLDTVSGMIVHLCICACICMCTFCYCEQGTLLTLLKSIQLY